VVGESPETLVRRYGKDGVTRDNIFWFLQRFEESYVAEVEDFVACLREGRAPRITGEDGRAALAIADAATQSFKEGRPVAVAKRPVPAGAA
jgi:myo-inositol 2-dehydrogenase/D-chiro-inositol 1-dehydrogenase